MELGGHPDCSRECRLDDLGLWGERVTIVGCYVPPSETDGKTLLAMEETVQRVDLERLIFVGDLNVRWKWPVDPRQVEIVDTLALFGLQDVAGRFKGRRSKPLVWTWRSADGLVRLVCDYMLVGWGVGRRRFKLVDMIFGSDHCLLTGRIQLWPSPKYHEYVTHGGGGRTLI